jgi:hypothetical protein
VTQPVTYRLFVNDARTMLVRVWDNGTVAIATRPDPGATWGPPLVLAEERA